MKKNKRRRMNKKGWIRIVEAVFAIMIIFGGAIMLISDVGEKVDISEDVYDTQRYILDIIANKDELRNDILREDTDNVNEYIQKNIPSSWGFTTNICNVDMICNENTPLDKDLYVSDTIISSSLSNSKASTKKLRFFVWRK